MLCFCFAIYGVQIQGFHSIATFTDILLCIGLLTGRRISRLKIQSSCKMENWYLIESGDESEEEDDESEQSDSD